MPPARFAPHRWHAPLPRRSHAALATTKSFPRYSLALQSRFNRPLNISLAVTGETRKLRPVGCKPATIPSFRVHDPHCGDTTKVLKKNRDGQRKPKILLRLAAIRRKSGLIGTNRHC